MALIVEDGSCVPDADSFVSLQEADDYFSAYGGNWEGDDADKEAALRRASLWLSTYPKWSGQRTCGRGQGLAWPRTGVTDCDEELIPPDVVPIEVKRATFAAALFELNNPGGLTPDLTPLDRLTKKEKVDVIEVEYMTARDLKASEACGCLTDDDRRPILTAIDDLIGCLIKSDVVMPYPFTV